MKKILICFFVFLITGLTSAFLGVPGEATFVVGGICALLYLILSRKKKKSSSHQKASRSSVSSSSSSKNLKKNTTPRKESVKSTQIERQRDTERSSYTSHTSRSQYDDYESRDWERERQLEEERQKKIRLEDWYREYVTIDVYFDYHYIDREYNSDYWEHRNEEIRVTRREAMALIDAGEGAIMDKLCYNNRSLISNVSYNIPYGLYNRPLGC